MGGLDMAPQPPNARSAAAQPGRFSIPSSVPFRAQLPLAGRQEREHSGHR
jgi:hypothetical protein